MRLVLPRKMSNNNKIDEQCPKQNWTLLTRGSLLGSNAVLGSLTPGKPQQRKARKSSDSKQTAGPPSRPRQRAKQEDRLCRPTLWTELMKHGSAKPNQTIDNALEIIHRISLLPAPILALKEEGRENRRTEQRTVHRTGAQ